MSVKTENKNVPKAAGNTVERAELRYVDPRTVNLGTNVRSNVEETIDPDFVDSIRELGILEPPSVQVEPDGTLCLFDGGARRTLGAIAADLAVYPVVVVAKSSASAADRLERQFHENDQRRPITNADRTAGYKQMALFGQTAAQIAKRTKTTTATVKAALRVADSQTARAAQVKHNLTIEQALAIDEFKDDDKVVAKLTEVATTDPGQFEHEVERRRDERQHAQELQWARKALSEAGVREVPNPGYGNTKVTRLGDLADAQGNRLTEETHRNCPGHAAYLEGGYGGPFVPKYVCTDPRANKHAKDGRVLGTPLSPKEKAERAAVRKYRDRWATPTKVRRRWLADFATKHTAPPGADEFIAMSVLEDGDGLAKAGNTGHALAAEWLGIKNVQYGGAHKAIAEMIQKAAKAGRRGRVRQIALVLALATVEARTSKDTWRSTREARYFLALQAFGYNLDEVEEIAAGLRTAVPDDPTLQAAEASTAPAPLVPVKDTASTGGTTNTTGQGTRNGPAKDTNADPTPGKAAKADKAQPARNPRKATTRTTTQTASTTKDGKPESATRQPLKPQTNATPAPEPATAGSR